MAEHVLPLAVAHRGGNEVAHENTLEAFQDAIDLGYRRIETDVHYTRHGELLAVHGQTIDGSEEIEKGVDAYVHIGEQAIRIADLTRADRQAIAHDGFYIPTLEEALSLDRAVSWNIDASSFLVSACTLSLIFTSFNVAEKREKKSIQHDVAEGLRYVLHHPVLRNISMMMALVNFVGSTTYAQLVLFAERQLHATDSQYSLMNAAGSAGVFVLSLLAGQFRKRWSFSRVALTTLATEGLLTIALAFTPWFWLAVPLWALIQGAGILFNINTSSLRQVIVPNQMLGRVLTIAGVLAWSAIPLGTLLGGAIIKATGNVMLVYAGIGVLIFLIPAAFSFTALGHAERYLYKKEEQAETNVLAEGEDGAGGSL